METPQLPLINCLHTIVVYETKARYYVVGSNRAENIFRVLKIDRTEPKDLHIVDDQVEYGPKEIRDLLLMIDNGNRYRTQTKDTNGLSRTVSAFGLVGFIRFLEGYYMILITKRRKIAQIGSHTVFKIEDTAMLYVPNNTARYAHPDEQKYLKMFQNVDLKSNFYFSYSYDLTRSLQYHMTPSAGLDDAAKALPAHQYSTIDITSQININNTAAKPTATKQSVDNTFPVTSDSQQVRHKSSKYGSDEALFNFATNVDKKRNERTSLTPDSDIFEDNQLQTDVPNMDRSATSNCNENQSEASTGNVPKTDNNAENVFGVRNEPEWKYVWNKHLLKDVLTQLHPDWLLYITHGFISQSNIQVFGKSIYLALIARRSNQFAGTRFLKRGANIRGQVANEVETEQIVYDASNTDLSMLRMASFVQLRGSLPFMWSQDLSNMLPKPTIEMDLADPYGFISGQHLNKVLARYGAPLIILNLLKKRERKPHESRLTEEIVKQLEYLNQFLPDEHRIRYMGFDMARGSKNKDKDYNVLERLGTIAEHCVRKTGFFHTGPELCCNEIRPHPCAKALNGLKYAGGMKQRGVVRTNCVDCLDRTNTAQFAMGKCALAFQLYVLGIIHKPQLKFDTDCVRMLEELYEDQGDTLALQYGGSQLVHRIKGYRNVAHWTSSSKDIMQTLSRYYRNAFSDTEKQQAINVFLGVFVPRESEPNIWDMMTDFYLHNPAAAGIPLTRPQSYTQWWDATVFKSLPWSAEELHKGHMGKVTLLKTVRGDDRVNQFTEHYQPYRFTNLGELFSAQMSNSVRDFMPKFAANCSPFALRIQPGRREEEYGTKSTEVNPNISGKDSTASTVSVGSDGSTSSSDSSDIEGLDSSDTESTVARDVVNKYVSFQELFPSMKETYGVSLKEPDLHNIVKYKRFAQIGLNASRTKDNFSAAPAKYSTELIQQSIFALDSTYSVEPPTVSAMSRDIYEEYVRRGTHGAREPSAHTKKIYQQYLSTNQHVK